MNTIVYHNTEKEARRARRPRPNETVSYRAKNQWNPDVNETFDEVIDLSTPKVKAKSKNVI
jgi:hypothetical protein